MENQNVKNIFCITDETDGAISDIRILNMEELEDVCSNSDEIIIYGAGRVCYALMQYLTMCNEMLDKIFCIMVSNKKNNPDNILGIPVCTRNEVGVREKATVLIATFENAHEAIYNELFIHDYKQVKAIGNIIYAQLRKIGQDFSVDIIQNTQWIRDDLGRVKNDILQVKNDILQAKNDILQGIREQNIRLKRMETCIQNNVRYPDELLSANQYEEALKVWYWLVKKKNLDLSNPQTFNEKIQWIKLYGVTPLMTKLTDKYAVREWVEEKIGKRYLVPLLGVWEKFEDINMDELPEKFVLKCNHGCEWNEIVQNKNEIMNKTIISKKK